jgi:ABC-type multidrug transport system fused ATPase/permease subunit
MPSPSSRTERALGVLRARGTALVTVAEWRRLVEGIGAGLRLLSPAERRRGLWLGGTMVVASALEIVAVAVLLPFINVVIQPSSITTNRLLKRLYELSGAADVSQFVFLVGGGVIAVTVASSIIGWVVLHAQNRFAASCQTRLATELLERALAAPYVWFLSRNSTTLSRLVYDDVVIWSRAFVQRVLTMTKDVLVVVMAMALVLSLSPRTGVAVVIVMTLLGAASVSLTRPLLTRLAITKREALDRTLLLANQAFAGINDVKLTSRQRHFGELFNTAYSTVSDTHATLNVWQETPTLVMRLLAHVTLVALALAFWRMGIGGGQIATQLALLLVVTTKVAPAVSALSTAVGNLVNAVPHIDAIHQAFRSIDAETAASSAAAAGKPVGDWREIRFASVGYRYPGAAEWALRDLSIELQREGSYGIVGRSAAGKSTLVDLLVRLLEPTTGTLWIDGEAADTLDARDWQRRIGYVPQAPFIADDTLRANVAFGVPRGTVDDQWIHDCLRMANLGALPAQLEHGLETRLGERGSRLSGGQRQRVAIARALYNRPEILVLDEATSALDAVSESEVHAALKNLRGRIMLVTIAHRVSTVAPCDEIFVLEDGQLAGRGTFAELLEQHHLFRRIADANA